MTRFVCALAALVPACALLAAVVPFASPHPGNAAAFSSWAAGAGLSVDRSINFDSHPQGDLIPAWYSASHGVTITATGPYGIIEQGFGSASNGVGATPVGEGYMPEPETYINTAFGTVVTVMFAQPVKGAGFMTADLFGPEQILALDLLDAGGVPYARIVGTNTDFQFDILYFLGAADADGFSGMRLTLPSPFGDSVYIPEIWFTYQSVACVADVDDGTGNGTPDGGVTIDDLLYYLQIFEAGDIGADADDGTGTGTPDGGVTIDDLLYYLQHFEAGC